MLLAFAALAAAAEVSLRLYPTFGEPIAFSLADQPSIEFKDGLFSLKGQSFEIADISKYTVGDPAGVSEANIGSAVSLEGRRVRLAGDYASAAVSLATLGGVVIPVAALAQDDTLLIDLTDFAEGVYVLTVGGSSFKIVLK